MDCSIQLAAVKRSDPIALNSILDPELRQVSLNQFAGEGLLKPNLRMSVQRVADFEEVHGSKATPMPDVAESIGARYPRGVITLATSLAFVTLAQPPAWKSQTVRATQRGMYEVEAKYPVLSGTSAVVRLANESLKADAEKFVRQAVSDLNSEFLPKGSKRPPNPYGYSLGGEVKFASPNLISVVSLAYSYTGGAHPNHYYVVSNFGLVNGKAKRLNIGDLFRPRHPFLNEITANVMPELVRREAGWVDSGALTEIDYPRANIFSFDKKGITFYFEAYSVGSYAEGDYLVTVPYAEFTGLSKTGPLRPILP